ncbi:hypothetical protein, partial [Methylocystis sp.]|uniref:hypothetical protein n=1 Tax=Methylocystis sp. TaxID=1911079 RepID=UPI003D10BF3A
STSDAPHQHHHSQPPSGVHLFDGGHLINSTCRAVGGRPITLTSAPIANAVIASIVVAEILGGVMLLLQR